VRAAERNTTATKDRGDAAHGLIHWEELPVAHVRVPVVHLPVPSAWSSPLAQIRWVARAISSTLPPPSRLLYYGGIGALALLGVLEWPVAAAVAAGVWVATHSGARDAFFPGTRPVSTAAR
jgi:hypothetical protein